MNNTNYTFDELLHKAASYCSISEHCISDVETKLSAWGIAPADKEQIIARLIVQDFLNEMRYCKAFVRDKFCFAKWGKIKIAQALKLKNINSENINQSLATIDEGEYEELLSSILKTKAKTITYHYEYEKQGKLFRFAQSRGFETGVIERVLRTITN